jgi:hypothetical protein
LTSIGEYYIDVLKWEAIAQANLSKYAEATAEGNYEAAAAYEKQFEFYKKMAAKQSQVVKELVKIHGGGTKPSSSSGTKSTRKTGSKSTAKTDNGAEDAEKQMQELINEANDMLDEWQKTATDRAIAIAAIVTTTTTEAYQEQVKSVRDLYATQAELIEENRDKAIAAEQEKYDKAIAEAKKYGKDTTDLEQARITALTALANDYQRQLEDNNTDMNDTLADMQAQRLAIIEDENEQEIAAITASYAEKANILRELYIEELRQTEGNEKAITEVRKRYAKDAEELAKQSAIDIAKATIDGLERALELEDMSDEDRERIAAELAKAKTNYAKAVADAEEAQLNRAVQAEQDARDKRMSSMQEWAQNAAQAIDGVAGLFSAMYDGQIAKIEEQMDAEEAHHEAQIAQIEELAERGAITQEEAELRKREAEARTAKAKEALEKKKAQAEYKRAVAEKANNISQIAIATALGIMKASPNWVMMALVGAMGAIQMATAIAQPIKAYKEGTKGKPHPGGLAVVGDGGKTELVVAGHNVWLTPDEPTLVDLPKGAEVYPEVTRETIERIGASLPMSIPRDKSSGQPIVINDYTALEDRVANNTKAIGKHLGNLERTLRKELRRQSFAAYLKDRL